MGDSFFVKTPRLRHACVAAAQKAHRILPKWLKASVDEAYVAEAGFHTSDSVHFEHLTVFFSSTTDPHLKVVAHIPCRYTVSLRTLPINNATLTFGLETEI